MPPLYEISDADSGQLRYVTRSEVPGALDTVCCQLAAELAANAEGGSSIRFRLAVHQVTPEGVRTWLGHRLYCPVGPTIPERGTCVPR